MPSLTERPRLLGFFSYSRADDGERKRLSKLRDKIKDELGAQLGRTEKNLDLWQDKESLQHGEQWERRIRAAISDSVFFIPVITPRAIESDHCHAEFNWFLAREAELERNDLFFPIHYIDVIGLTDKAQSDPSPVLRVVAARQMCDWRHLRHHDINSREVDEAVTSFCRSIANALRKRQPTPQERRREEEAEAGRRAQQQEQAEAEARKRAEDEARALAEEAEARVRLEKARMEKEGAQLAAKEARRKKAEQWRRADEALKRQAGEAIHGLLGGLKRALGAVGQPTEQQPTGNGARPDAAAPDREWAATIARNGNNFSIRITGPSGSHRVEFSARALAVDKLVIDGVARPAPRWPGKRNSHQFTLGSDDHRFELTFAVDNLGIRVSSIELSADGRTILQTD